MPYDVRLPNGVVIQDVPEDADRDAFRAQVFKMYPELGAKEKRTFGEAFTDVGASLVKGVGSLAQIPGQISDLTGITKPEDEGTGLQAFGKKVEEFGEEAKSPVLKAKEAIRGQKIAEADGFFSEFGTAIKETIKDPALVTSFFAEQVPNLVGSMGGGLLVKGTTKALMYNASKEALEATLPKAAVRGAIGTGAIMQGADVGSDTYEAAYKELTKMYPDMGGEEKQGIALSKGRVAALEALALSIGASRLPGGASIERALVGKGMPGVGGFTKGAFGEAISEGIEEGGGAFAKNVGLSEINPEIDLLKGVGTATGFGALGGALFGGPAGIVNAKFDSAEKDKVIEFENQRQAALQAIEDVKTAEDQARRDVFAAQNEAIRLRAIMERGDITDSNAYAELQEKVAAIQEKTAAAQAKTDAIRDKADAEKAKFSAFADAEPDLFGKVYPQIFQSQETQTAVAPVAQPGQLELGLADQQGQLGLPGIGIAQPRQPSLEAEMPQGRPVTEDDFKTMGVGSTNKALRAAILGKDLTDPVQAAEVRTALETYASGDRSAKIIKGVESFLALPDFQEQQKLNLRRPYGSMKKPVPEGIDAETESPTEVIEDVRQPTQDVAGIAEPSIYIPGQRRDTTARAAEPTAGGVVSDRSPTGQPSGREAAVSGTLEAAEGLNPRQEKEFKDAAANYIQRTNSPEQALDYLAGDLYAKENTKLANRFFRGLPNEQKAYVEDKIAGFKQQERRGNVEIARLDAMREKDAANREEYGDEGDIVYRTAAEDATGMSVREVQSVVNQVIDGWKNSPIIQVVQSVEQLPQAIQNQIAKDNVKRPQGVWDEDTQAVYLIADNLSNSSDVGMTIAHEALGHYGLRVILGDLYNKTMDTMYKNKAVQVRADAKKGLSKAIAVEEVLAEMAETGSNPSVIQQLVNILRSALRAIGIDLKGVTNGEVAQLIKDARQYVIEGKGEAGKGTIDSTESVFRSAKEQAEELYKATGAKVSPPSKGPFQAIKETTPAEAKSAVKQFLNKAETMWFSSDAALNNRIRQELEKNGTDWDALKEMMLQVSTSQALHADAVAMQFLEQGDVKYDPETFKFMAKQDKNSWQNIIKQVSAAAKTHDVAFDDMSKYARKALEAKRLKGLKESKSGAYIHMTDEQIAAGMELYKVFPELNDIQATWNAVRKNTMKLAVDSGLYTEEQAKELLDFMDYVPFYRVEQLMANAGPKEYSRGLLDFAKNYKFQGSEQQVEDLFDNMERWVSYTVSRAVKNRTALNMKNTAMQLMPDEVRELRQDAKTKKEQNTIDIWENGVKKKVEFDDPLFVYAFQGAQPVTLPILKGFASVANILRKNIVLMPLFSVSQLSQDSIGAMFTSGLKQPFKLPAEVIKEFVRTMRGTSQAAKELTKYGAAGVRDFSATIARNEVEIASGLKAPTRMQKILAPLEKIAMASDNAVRQAIYNRTIAEGGDKATAVEKAFEIINFKRGGASGTVTVLRQIIPFYGAYLQAQNVALKTLAGRGISPVERKEAHKVLLSTTAKIMALGFIYAALCADDEDYQKMDPTIRDRHLMIPGTPVMLPLRSDVFLLPKLIAEYTYQGITDQGFTDAKKMRRGMKDAILNAVLSPTVVPQAVKPAAEVLVNYNFFTGRPLVGQGLENKITAEQFTNTTSELAKFLGKAGIIAPVNIDHLIRGYLGTTGGLGLMVINEASDVGSNIPRPEKSWQDAIASTPGLSAFVAKEYGSGVKNDFYELRKDVDKAVNTFNNMRKTGRVEEAKEFYEENKPLFAVKSQVNNIERQLAKIRAQQKIIYAAPESRMTGAQKGQEIEKLKQVEDRMLKNIYKLRERAGY